MPLSPQRELSLTSKRRTINITCSSFLAKRLKDFSIENSINNKQAKTLPSAVQSEKPTILYLSSVNCQPPLCTYVTEVTLYGHANVFVQTWKKASGVKGNISAASVLLVWPEFVLSEHFRLNFFFTCLNSLSNVD